MSTPDSTPATIVGGIDPTTFGDVVETAKADEKTIANGALQYLESALKVAEGQADVLVGEVTTDAEAYAFKIASEHGFAAYLAIFKSAIDNGKAKIDAAISLDTHAAIEKGIAHLKTVESV